MLHRIRAQVPTRRRFCPSGGSGRTFPRSRRRPIERFWPYVDLSEQPTEEELAALDPELAAALYGTPPRPFSLTFSFPPFEGPDYERAVELARGSLEYREGGAGGAGRHRARFPCDPGL